VISVYIVEAHPSDEWALNDGMDEGSACIMQPRTLQQRLTAAKNFATRFEYPTDLLFIDNMQNSVAAAYGAEPERLYAVFDGKLVYCGGMGPYHYDVGELREFVTSWLHREQQPRKENTGLLTRFRRAFSLASD